MKLTWNCGHAVVATVSVSSRDIPSTKTKGNCLFRTSFQSECTMFHLLPATKLKRRKKLGFWKFSKNITLPRPWFLSTPRKAGPHREPIKLPIQFKGEQGRTVAIPNGLPSLNFCNFMPEISRISFLVLFCLNAKGLTIDDVSRWCASTTGKFCWIFAVFFWILDAQWHEGILSLPLVDLPGIINKTTVPMITYI